MNPRLIGIICHLTRQSISKRLPDVRSLCQLPAIIIERTACTNGLFCARKYAQSVAKKSGCMTCLKLTLADQRLCARYSSQRGSFKSSKAELHNRRCIVNWIGIQSNILLVIEVKIKSR